jgi:hypothetical protein
LLVISASFDKYTPHGIKLSPELFQKVQLVPLCGIHDLRKTLGTPTFLLAADKDVGASGFHLA